jgi:hypothetical protein
MDMQGVSPSTANSMAVQAVSVSLSYASSMDVRGVSPSTVRSMDMQAVSLSTASSIAVQAVSTSTDSSVNVQDESQSIVCRVDVYCRVYVFLFTFVKYFFNAEMPDCPASGQSGTGMNKNSDAVTISVQKGDPVRYLLECSGTGLRYRMPESRWHRPRSRCLAMDLAYTEYAE